MGAFCSFIKYNMKNRIEFKRGIQGMIETHVCRNGVRIVHEKMPHVRSVALGIWVGAGSGDEMESEAGIAHFIEHMLFKGTAITKCTYDSRGI